MTQARAPGEVSSPCGLTLISLGKCHCVNLLVFHMAHPASLSHRQSQCDCTFDESGVQCDVVQSVSNPGAMGELQCLIGRVIGSGSAKVNHSGFGGICWESEMRTAMQWGSVEGKCLFKCRYEKGQMEPIIENLTLSLDMSPVETCASCSFSLLLSFRLTREKSLLS